eukprot:TRINITY_DN3835_c0_g2_i1.p1 TRINITY_DN3835_c0_g2~~TRINITY_DN3835_c0_g2_i1.p1  ORF type:complete len:574 (-),score=232.58 TRINITY_DN3835_c0_g2_i1:157-1878(-)
MIDEVRTMIGEAEAATAATQDAQTAATEGTAQADNAEAMQVDNADPAAAEKSADPEAPEGTSENLPPAAAETAAPALAEASEAPAAEKTEAPAAEKTEAGAAQEKPQQADASALELAWRKKLAGLFREWKRTDYLKGAIEVAAPGLMEKTLAFEQKKLDDETEKAELQKLEEKLEEEAELSRSLGPEHVKKLAEELARLLEQAEKGAARPRALVRAMQMLYLAESAADAVASLRPETADEEALRQLAERTEEFAPALDAMRSLAVDKDVFAHLADEIEHEHQDLPESESEASDVGKELAKNEPAPVVLPQGWRLEWVKRKKKEMREFVSPDGTRYRNVKEVREALVIWEAMQAAKAAAAKAAEAAAARGEQPPPKRTRLRGKSSAALSAYAAAPAAPAVAATIPSAPPAPAAVDEDAFAEDLLAALGVDDKATGETKKPTAGAEVLVKGFTARAQLHLNGKRGRLGKFDSSTGKWDCLVDGSVKMSMSPSNFDVVPPTSAGTSKSPAAQVKRGASAEDQTRRVRAKAAARGAGGKGRGRGGRGQEEGNSAAAFMQEINAAKPAVLPQDDGDSD